MNDILDGIRGTQAMIERLAGPSIRMIEDLNRHQAMIERLAGPSIRMVEEVNRHARWFQTYYYDVAGPVIRMAEDMHRTLELLEKRHQKFVALVRKLKWPPPGHLPCTVLDRIADAYSSGKLSDSDVEDLFVRAYSPRILAEIGGKWASYQWLAERLPILQEALANYPDERYASVVCTLMPQFEGLLGTVLGRKPNPEIDGPTIFRDSPHGTLVSDYYLQVILATFQAWNPSLPVPDLSRHAILHGRATTYGTKVHALKLIIVTDYLLASLDDRRSGTP